MLLSNLCRWTTLFNLFFSPTPHDVIGTKVGRYYNRYVRRASLYVKKPSFNRFWWKCCWLFNFNKLLSPFCFLYSFVFNMFFLRFIDNYKCRCKWCSVPSKVLQSLSKSFSYGGSMFHCLKFFLLYVSTFSRTPPILMKCKRRSWCKWFNIYCYNCSKNFLSNPLQFSCFCFFFFSLFSKLLPFSLLSFKWSKTLTSFWCKN